MTYDTLDEEMLARMLTAADPETGRFDDVVTVRLSAVLLVVSRLLEGHELGLVISVGNQ